MSLLNFEFRNKSIIVYIINYWCHFRVLVHIPSTSQAAFSVAVSPSMTLVDEIMPVPKTAVFSFHIFKDGNFQCCDVISCVERGGSFNPEEIP